MKRILFFILTLCLIATPAYANRMPSMWGTLTMMAVFLFGLALIASIACIATCIAKPNKKNLKVLTVFLVLGCIAAGSKLYLTGNLPVFKPCCTARYHDGLKLPGYPRKCRVCEDSLALRPPLEVKYITSGDVSRRGKNYLFKGLFPEGSDTDYFSKTVESIGARKMILCDASTRIRLENTLAYAIPSIPGDGLKFRDMAVATHDGHGKIIRTEFKWIDWSPRAPNDDDLRVLAEQGNPQIQRALGSKLYLKNSMEDAYFWLTISTHHPVYSDNAGAIKQIKIARESLTAEQLKAVDERIADWEKTFATAHPEGDCLSVYPD